jgi:tripartite-type tricarboxylate transporter receptor subunit TctC
MAQELRRAAVSIAILLILCGTADAQSQWPTKPVKILVPTAPGGTADATARLFAQHLGKVLGQQFYIENRGGAGNTLGIESVARSRSTIWSTRNCPTTFCATSRP